jgi:LysR family transcriptional regulator, glycine cleavage system transcriptional activator
MQHVDFTQEELDVAIRHGQGQWPGMHVARLCEEELFPVCSPKLLGGRRALRTPADLAHHPLLHAGDWSAWQEWLRAYKVPSTSAERGIVFNQASMAIDAAIEGQGVALARTALAAWDLLGKRLVRPFRQALKAPFAMWIVCPRATSDVPKVAIFREWLLNEAADDARRLQLLKPASVARSGH